MKSAKWGIFWAMSLSLVACKTAAPPPATKAAPVLEAAIEKDPSLKETEAVARSKRVQKVAYDVRIKLAAKEKSFSGDVEIRFEHIGLPVSPLRVDFQKGQVLSVTNQGKKIDYTVNSEGVELPVSSLTEGANRLKIAFKHDFSTDGSGFMKVVDPEDQNEYHYTNLEPYGASRVIPCFDQPDLKARFRLEVEAPGNWEVVSTTREERILNPESGNRIWLFPESLPISTYVWSVHAGPFKVWEDPHSRVPLRLFARQTLAKHVRPKDWFRYTRTGFRFYERLFRTPYPFQKYDQLIVPEFASGAMENVGAVTFNEAYIKRSKPTIRDQRSLADTLLHELAHMWFGNLVTMRWWNGLWLNESFATYVSALAMRELPEFRDFMRVFNGEKGWAYRSDQLVTTHPIEVPVADTAVAESIFDGISYGKGASVLKQLHFLVGEGSFEKGLQLYFKKHAFSNTELADFIGSIAKASNRDLKRWTHDWLETSGTNLLRPEFECADGKISKFEIFQSAARGEQPLRQHRFRIATFVTNQDPEMQGKVALGESFEVEIDQAKTPVSSMVGKACPLAVYLNESDYGFFQVEMDARSRAFLIENFGEVIDPFLRQLVIMDFYRMVRSGAITSEELERLIRNPALWAEKDEIILKDLFAALSSRRPFSLVDLIGLARPEGEKPLRDFVEDQIWKRIASQELKGDDFKLWWDAWVNTVQSDAGVKRLIKVFDGQENVVGLTLDTDRKWSIARRVAVLGNPEAARMLATMKKNDPSKAGVDQSIGVEHAFPDLARKRALISESLQATPKYTMSQFRGAYRSLFPFLQRALLAQYRTEYFVDFERIAKTKGGEWGEQMSNITPQDCTAESIDATRAFLARGLNLNPQAEKNLKVAIQENEECLAFVKGR